VGRLPLAMQAMPLGHPSVCRALRRTGSLRQGRLPEAKTDQGRAFAPI
jgi:hypothetical protein